MRKDHGLISPGLQGLVVLQDVRGEKTPHASVMQNKGRKQKLSLCAYNGREENCAFEFSSE